MNGDKMTLGDLRQRQSLPLAAKKNHVPNKNPTMV